MRPRRPAAGHGDRVPSIDQACQIGKRLPHAAPTPPRPAGTPTRQPDPEGTPQMTHQDVELLAIGAGPSNLALAVALEELAPDLAANSLLIERAEAIVWQQGLLLPWATSQISFLKDLVTLRNPCSEFSFINFL